jgi:hypothetical protein
MQPWLADSQNKIWALREAGKQILVYSGTDAELDLSAEPGEFRLNAVDMKTGSVMPGEKTTAGGKLKLPRAGVFWLTKEQR